MPEGVELIRVVAGDEGSLNPGEQSRYFPQSCPYVVSLDLQRAGPCFLDADIRYGVRVEGRQRCMQPTSRVVESLHEADPTQTPTTRASLRWVPTCLLYTSPSPRDRTRS